ncbi:hypothetical protein DL546_003300 [Coniochaeta pulveracea]|uniref:Uncharacterized protein n=1 Tax=Coniochaeta pulveracea TaxID=177199 RepID=A0A420YKR9_9PEZI|nr:hypothetical protein DL546_003300 [Coniochaeta pulveracea]
MSSSGSQAGASGAGDAPGATGPVRNCTPRTGRFADLTEAHSAILGRPTRGSGPSVRSEAPAAEQTSSAGGEEEQSSGGGSPPLSLLLEPMREASSSSYGNRQQGLVVGSSADSANHTVGDIIDAYAGSTVVEDTSMVASRSVSQHTATLYRLDPEQARRDGATNLLFEEVEDEDELPPMLRQFAPPRAQLPNTPPAASRPQGWHLGGETDLVSPSSVATGVLAVSSPPAVAAVPAAFVRVPVQGQGYGTTREPLRSSWASLPGPDVGAAVEHLRGGTSRLPVAVVAEESWEHDVQAQLRQAASTIFSQSPEQTPLRPPMPAAVAGSAPVRVVEPSSSVDNFSYASPEVNSSTDRILDYAEPHAGTSSAASEQHQPRTRRGGPLPSFVFPPRPVQQHRINGLPVNPSDGTQSQQSTTAPSTSGDPRGRFPIVPTHPPSSPTPQPSSSAGSATRHFPVVPTHSPSSAARRRFPVVPTHPFAAGSNPLVRSITEQQRKRFEFRDTIIEPKVSDKGQGKQVAPPYDEAPKDLQQEGKGKGIAYRDDELRKAAKPTGKVKDVSSSAYQRLDDYDDEPFYPSRTPAAAIHRPMMESGHHGSNASISLTDSSQFPFKLISRDEAARIQADKRARGEFDDTIFGSKRLPSSSSQGQFDQQRLPSSSSRMHTDSPGAPLAQLIKAHERKPLPGGQPSWIENPHRPRQRFRGFTNSSRRSDRRADAHDLGPEAVPTSPLNRPGPSLSSTRPTGHIRMGSTEIFNSFINREGNLVTRYPGVRPSQATSSQFSLTQTGEPSVSRPTTTQTGAGDHWEDIELGIMPSTMEPTIPTLHPSPWMQQHNDHNLVAGTAVS